MPVRKLKPIEERDPYAAAVLNAFDEQDQLAALRRELAAAQAERDELGWALDAQNAVNAQLCKDFAGLEWLLRERKAVFWHAGVNVFVVGEWRYQAPTLTEAIALAVKGFKGEAK